MTNPKVKATIYLPDGVHRRLKIRAVEERSSMTELVLRAIEELLSRPARVEAKNEGMRRRRVVSSP